MNRLKKLASLVLALVMAMALAAPASAASIGGGATGSGNNTGNNGSILIDNAIRGQTYSIYRIFTLESFSDVTLDTPPIDPNVGMDIASGNFSYKLNPDWKGFFEKKDGETMNPAGADYVALDEDGYVTGWLQNDENGNPTGAAEFAKAALAWAKANDVTADQTETTPAKTETETGTVKVLFENLPLGYYLVDSTTGTLCSLNTSAVNVIIKEKNKEPVNTKEVQEDSTVTTENPDGDYGDKNDADIGQTVNFKSTIIAQAGAAKYVFHDKMSAGLTFTASSVTVTLYKATTDAEGNVTYDEGTKIEATGNWELKDYSAEGATKPTDGCTFEIVFDQVNFCDTLGANDKIVISYSAVLNENAEVGVEGNPNESKLSYGDEGKSETTPSKTTTYTWEFDIYKYTPDETATGGKTPLAGAEFVLSTSETAPKTEIVDGKAVLVTDTEKMTDAEKAAFEALLMFKDKNGVLQCDYTKAAGGKYIITTPESGTVNLEGLDASGYYLHEINAPAGYNKLTAPVVFQIVGVEAATTLMEGQENYTDEMGKILTLDANDEPVKVDQLEVQNLTGAQLPSTGGIGTTIFYIVGGVLAAGAVILLITKRRMNIDK